MSVIQKIRDKYAAVAIATIAIAMVGFILIDAFSNRGGGGMFSKDSNTLGKVNGEKIEFVDFDGQLKRAEDNYQRQGMTVTESLREEINNTLWSTLVDKNLLSEQTGKLGLTFTNKELETLIYGPNPPGMFRQAQFQDPKTGQYDPSKVAEYIRQVKRHSDTAQDKIGLEDYLYNQVTNEALRNKYLILLMGAAYYPKWLADKDNQDNSSLASISYTAISYALVPDSSISVSESEINDYVSAHKGEFQTTEASRSVSYVVFDADPSEKDSAAALAQVVSLKAGLADTKDPSGFLNQNGTSLPYYDGYVSKTAIQVPNKDSILSLPIGGIYGPYLDGNQAASNVVIAKLVDKKDFPDSVKCHFILISDQNGQIPDSVAKAKADSIATVAQKGGDFKALAAQVSDEQTADKGKDNTIAYTQAYPMNNAQGGLPKTMAEFLFTGKKGDRKVVKFEGGYVYTEILDQTNFEPYYKVAYLGKEVLPSDETTTAANAAATSFASDAQGSGAFEETARKHNVALRSAAVKETDYQVQGLGQARRLVRWAFDNKKGTIGDPESFGNKFVVAQVTGAQDAGLPSGSFARTLVENSVRHDKKAKQIIDKLGPVSDLNAAASKFGITVQHADSVRFEATFVPNLGNEPKVVGAAFNKTNLNKVSAPIQGTSGVFFVRTDGVTSIANPNFDYNMLRQSMEGTIRNSLGYNALDGLRKAANIVDNRIKFFGQ